MKVSRRELNTIKRRVNILKAARRLFSRNGFETTTIEEIADMAEVSRATLYNYFPSKENLLIGIAEDELENIRLFIRNELTEVEKADEKIKKVLEVFILDSIPYINLSRKITYLNSCEESNLFATRLEMIQIFKELVEEAQQQRIFKQNIPSSDIVDIIMGVYLMSQFQWKNIADYTEEYCSIKLNRLIDLSLQGIYR